jgi:hypothetical protein
MTTKHGSIGKLQPLAASRGFRVVSRGGEFWLVNLRNRLPETNKRRQTLVFSGREAEEFLRGLSEIGADPGKSGRR